MLIVVYFQVFAQLLFALSAKFFWVCWIKVSIGCYANVPMPSSQLHVIFFIFPYSGMYFSSATFSTVFAVGLIIWYMWTAFLNTCIRTWICLTPRLDLGNGPKKSNATNSPLTFLLVLCISTCVCKFGIVVFFNSLLVFWNMLLTVKSSFKVR